MADKIRKVIGKKRDPKEFAPFKKMFMRGCVKKAIFSRREALDFWEMLQSHARYSFNKSHSIAYAVLAYYCGWVKKHYPAEFVCANLSFGSEIKKEEVVKEAYRLGLDLVLPEVGVSDPLKWFVKENKLYVPLIEVKGIGEKLALQEASKRPSLNVVGKTVSSKLEGFFGGGSKKSSVDFGKLSKTRKLLNAIKKLEEEGNYDELSKFFSFRINKPIMKKPLSRQISKLRSPSLPPELLDIFKCRRCDLRKECRQPVLPSVGGHNIAIWGEAPGPDEDAIGKGFVGKAGKLLWGELAKYKLYRRDFYVSNVCKCFPKQTRTPNKEQIQECYRWAELELQFVKPVLILAFGNTGLKAFSGVDSGITGMSGKIEWVEKLNAWVCWCIHPSAVLRNPSNREAFEKGIKKFSDKVFDLGDIK